jgi:hypothetical protein
MIYLLVTRGGINYEHLELLGIYADEVKELKKDLSDEWEIIERRRNPDNDFCRVDIIKRVIK